MPYSGAAKPRDGDIHAGQVLARERLMRAEAEHRLANLLQFVSANLARAARGSQGMRLADTLATQAGGRCRWLFTRTGTEVEVLLPL